METTFRSMSLDQIPKRVSLDGKRGKVQGLSPVLGHSEGQEVRGAGGGSRTWADTRAEEQQVEKALERSMIRSAK